LTLTGALRIGVIRRFARYNPAGRSPAHPQPSRVHRHFLAALLGFSLLAVYGSLVPLHGLHKTWSGALGELFDLLSRSTQLRIANRLGDELSCVRAIGFFATVTSRKALERPTEALTMPIVVGGCVLRSIDY